jgi:hypothetical protein
MPSCNLTETIHNKWKQQSGNRGDDLYVATVDDFIRAFMQATNYRAYLKGRATGMGPSKSELRLRAARRSRDPAKIATALSMMPGAEELCTRIPHLEREEVFGSTKRKLDLPIGSEGDSHRPDKLNYSQPRVQTRSTKARVEDSTAMPTAEVPLEVLHVTSVLESDCNTSEWHIARISHKSSTKCSAN